MGGELSVFNLLSNITVTGALAGLKLTYPFIPTGALEQSIGDHWNLRTPPLPWDDGTGRPFASDVLYQKAYYEWRGQTCVIIPVINKLACFENILVPNKYADLFQYVPLANTTDKHGAEKDFVAVIQPEGETKIKDKSYDPPYSAPLWYAHTQEVKDLSAFLNKSYTPKNFKAGTVNDTEKNDCQIVNVRSNPGDNLFPGQSHGIEVPNVEYTITQVLCSVKLQEECNTDKSPNKCAGGPTACCPKKKLSCDAEVSITLPTVTATPWADEIFQNTVANSGSTFRRIYPKTGADAPVSCIADIPGSSGVTYTAKDPVGNGAENFKVKDPTDVKTDNPQIYFPHLGSVYDYFLKGIQTALRPKGFGEGSVISAQTCSNVVCGELPKSLPKAQGSCNLGGVSSKVGKIPQSLKDIVSAAAQTYKVPPNLIIAEMYGEGLFNTDANGKYNRFNWTDQNVKNWATCEKIPNCSETGDDHFMGFNGSVFDQIAEKIGPDIRKIDPSRKKLDRCNLLDSIYAAAYNLHQSSGGSPAFPAGATCYGKPLNNGTSIAPQSCDWSQDKWYESAIRIYEFGTQWGNTSSGFLTCATDPGSCATGGIAAQCNSDTLGHTDSCVNTSEANSHNGCVWDVAHGH